MLEGDQVAVMMRMFIESAKQFLQVGYLVLNQVLWGGRCCNSEMGCASWGIWAVEALQVDFHCLGSHVGLH